MPDRVKMTSPVSDENAGGGSGGSGYLTDAELRATPVPVSGPATDAQMRATPLPVDTELGAAGPLATEATLASANTTLGATTGAAVVTDANGSIQQYLRGIVAKLVAAFLAANTARTTGTLVLPVQNVDAAGLVSGALPASATLSDAAVNPITPLQSALLLGYNGVTWDRIRLPNIQKDLSTVAIGSITTVWTPTSGKKFRLMGGVISVSAAASVLFEDNAAGTTVFRTAKLLADTPFNFVVNGGQGYLSAAANNVLKATASASANIIGTLWGVEE